jgi:thioredoxin
MKRIILFAFVLTFCGILSAQETAVKQLGKADFLEKIMNYEKNPDKWVYLGDKPCIIDFYADWCRPCKIASPILEELAEKYKGKIDFYKVNTDIESSLKSAFGIQSIPAFLYCPQNGNPQMSVGVAHTAEETKALFEKIIKEFLLK